MLRRCLTFLISYFLIFCGCSHQQGAGGDISSIGETKAVSSSVQESGFPANLAGTWKADVSKWSITLGPEGEIISSINEAGMNMVMAEGGLLQEGGGGNRYLLFQFGDSFTEYNRESRKLTATINIESLSMVFKERSFEGDMKYVISGSISDDGNRWLADVETYMTLEDLKSGDKPATVERLLFRKVDVD